MYIIIYLYIFLFIYISFTFIYIWPNDLVSEWPNQSKKICNISRFIGNLNFINDGGEFESNYSNIYPAELQLGKENTDKNETSFLDLNIKIKDGEFHFGLFDKIDSFPFSIVRMPDK